MIDDTARIQFRVRPSRASRMILDAELSDDGVWRVPQLVVVSGWSTSYTFRGTPFADLTEEEQRIAEDILRNGLKFDLDEIIAKYFTEGRSYYADPKTGKIWRTEG